MLGSTPESEGFTLMIDRFGVDKNGDVTATGTLTGDCQDVSLSNAAFEVPVEVGDASCDAAELELADVSVFDPRSGKLVDIELSEATAVLIPGSTDDRKLRSALCSLAAVAENGSPRAVAAALNRVLG